MSNLVCMLHMHRLFVWMEVSTTERPLLPPQGNQKQQASLLV